MSIVFSNTGKYNSDSTSRIFNYRGSTAEAADPSSFHDIEIVLPEIQKGNKHLQNSWSRDTLGYHREAITKPLFQWSTAKGNEI